MEKELARRYDRIASEYAEKVFDNFWNNVLEYPITVSEIRKLSLKRKRVVDLGCGSGRYTEVFLRLGARVWGIDNSRKMLDIAMSRIKGAKFKVGNVCKTGYRTGFFDIAFSALVLEHVNHKAFFREASRIMKSNGILLVSTRIPYTTLATEVGPRTFKFSDYFDEGKKYRRWPNFGIDMCFRHATMQSTIRAMIRNGFVIEDYIDMKPPKWSRKKFRKSYGKAVAIPQFCLIKLRKLKKVES